MVMIKIKIKLQKDEILCASVNSSLVGREAGAKAGVWEGREVVSWMAGDQTLRSTVSQTLGIRTELQNWALKINSPPEHFITGASNIWMLLLHLFGVEKNIRIQIATTQMGRGFDVWTVTVTMIVSKKKKKAKQRNHVLVTYQYRLGSFLT